MESDSFASVLRDAIAARGLTLGRLRAHLQQRGVTVSTATLSYWQTGRRRPERALSFDVLTYLEELLHLPAGELTSRVGASRRAGGPRTAHPWLVEPESNVHGSAQLAEAIHTLCARWNHELVAFVGHERCWVTADRRIRQLAMWQAFRATADGPDRTVVFWGADQTRNPAPEIQPIRNCTLGRTQVIGSHIWLSELLLAHPLARGEIMIIEYQVVCDPPIGEAVISYHHRNPAHLWIREVHFEPSAIPKRCWEYTAQDDTGVPKTAPVPIDSHHIACSVLRDCDRGESGLRWEW